MDADPNQRLSQIVTLWSDVLDAKAGPGGACRDAQARLMQRYGGAVHRYLLGATRDPDVAEELAQEFALRFLRGDFKRADPQRGRFRNFVKTAVLNLVTDHRRRQKARPQGLGPDAPEPTGPGTDEAKLDREFLTRWREELLARAWAALERAQDHTDQPLHAALKFRAEFPDLSSAEMAEKLGLRLGRPLNANGVRQLLHRARKVFAEFLLEDVIQSLDAPTADQVEQELIDLGLWEYCRPLVQGKTGA